MGIAGKMATLSRIGTTILKHRNGVFRPSLIRAAGISTSKKKKDTISVTDAVVKDETAKTEAVAETNKNWVSWGFSIESEEEDNTNMHMIFFVTVTICLVGGAFMFAYIPDYKMRDWTQREAFLELRRREAEGLPLIDRNLVNPENIELPDDEELGNTEIII